MATKRKARRRNTALVVNPAAGSRVSLRSNGRRKSVRRKRRNPVTRTVAARKANPSLSRRVVRRRNPSSVGSLVAGGLMAAVGVTAFDLIVGKVMPQQSPLVRVGVKLGGAIAFQSYGSKIPVIGKHKDAIALVLAVAGFADLLKMYAVPVVNQAWGQVANLLPSAGAAAQVTDGTTQDIYGQNRRPTFYGGSLRAA